MNLNCRCDRVRWPDFVCAEHQELARWLVARALGRTAALVDDAMIQHSDPLSASLTERDGAEGDGDFDLGYNY